VEQIVNSAVWLISFQKYREIIVRDAALEGDNRTEVCIARKFVPYVNDSFTKEM